MRARTDAGGGAGTYGGRMPTGTTSDITRHSFTAPRFERAKVLDAMRLGVVSCAPDTTLREVARIMATYRIHSVVVTEMPEGAPLGVISAVDIAAGAQTPDASAATVARTEVLTVSPEESLERAAQLMAQHDVMHLVAVQPHSGHPVGILSALDVAGVIAWAGTE
jgi:CBS domain-containing protein